MCGYADSRFGPSRRDMDPGIWRSLLPLLRSAWNVGLHGAGEPLLYPYLEELLLALGRGPSVGFNSNGHLLSSSASRKLVEAGLGWISVSVDAADALTYQRIRRRRDFDALIGKIGALREMRDASGSARPRIEMNMTLMQANLVQAPAFVDLAARAGADGVMFQEIQPGGDHRVVAPDGWTFDYREQELGSDGPRGEVLGEARRRAVALGLEFNCEILYGSVQPGPSVPPGPSVSRSPLCLEPWRRLLIDVEGNAFVCCVQKSNRILLGRCPDDPVEEIWNGRKVRLVREAMYGGANHPCCAGCFRVSRPG